MTQRRFSEVRMRAILSRRNGTAFLCSNVEDLKREAIGDCLSAYQKAKLTAHLATCNKCRQSFSKEDLKTARLWLRSIIESAEDRKEHR